MKNYSSKISILKKDYSVKSVIIFRGREWEGYNANLFYGDKEIAFILNEGSGGLPWIDEKNSTEVRRLEIECKKVGKVPSGIPELGDIDYDIFSFIEDLVDDYDNPAGWKEMMQWYKK